MPADTDALRHFLLQHAPFSKAELEEACGHFTHRQFKKGEHFVYPDKVCKEAAFIAEGALKVWYLNQAGEVTVSCFCTAPCITTAYRSFARQTPSDLGITAIVPTQLFVLRHEDFQQLMATRPVWHELGRRLLEQEYLEMEQYATLLNNEDTREKYLRLLAQSPEVVNMASVADLASHLGVTRRTLSRIRREMAEGK
jgi:CRP-like cAMP-binding protein